MRLLIATSLLVMAAHTSWGEPGEASSQSQNATSPDRPAPQLVALEKLLSERQQSRDSGILPPEQYQQFVAKFRVDLELLIPRIPPTPANQALHALILSRLGESDRAAAGTELAQALEANPSNSALLHARGQILFEQRDFPAAAEAARQAWEASGRKDKAAWALLKMSEGRIAGTTGSTGTATKPPATAQLASLEWAIPQNHDISPQAMGHVQKAIATRKQGDLAATWASAQAAMNADPTSEAVQKFYEAVRIERVQAQETRAFIQNAVKALGAGHGEEAIAWAQKAYERSPGDDTKAVLDDVRRRSGALSSTPEKAPSSKGSSPLLPLLAAGGAGLTALGLYKVAISRSAKSSEDGLNPSPEVSPEQERRNYNSIAYVAIPAVVFALVYGGPPAWRAAAPTMTALLRGGQQSIQRVAASEAGALTTGTVGASTRVPGFTAQESQIINEAQQILSSPQFRRLKEAYSSGSPTVVRIGGRVVQYEPEMPSGYSGMALFEENGFVLGRNAFKSTTELQKTVLHELHRLSTTQSNNGVNAALASRETDAAYSFAERAAGALYR